MPMVDVQLVTMVESVVLLGVNAFGVLITTMAWRVSTQDVRFAMSWEPVETDPVECIRRRHNRRIVTMDARYGERGRLHSHILIALVGMFWLLTPQPTNPHVTWWAVVIRGCLILVSMILVDKTIHHLIARWRFDRPDISQDRLSYLWPALVLAWHDMRNVDADYTRRT